MRYTHISEGIFLERPNRFVAKVLLEGKEETCHVKNTGRCRELLVPGARVLLEKAERTGRKTAYDLVSVYKGNRLINMDSQAPNQLAYEWLAEGNYFKNLEQLGREKTYGDSRFDLYGTDGGRPFFMEVKGVTLEEEGIVRFPDAPTERGVKHIKELIRCRQEGYGAYLLFVIQMKGVTVLEPNWETHQAFGNVLAEAVRKEVRLLAYDCIVKPDFVQIDKPVPIWINKPESLESGKTKKGKMGD